jgi:hypothetical protein
MKLGDVVGGSVAAQETDHAGEYPPGCSSPLRLGGMHRRPQRGRGTSTAVFVTVCVMVGLVAATAIVFAVPRSQRTVVFLAVQAAATALGVLAGLLHRRRPVQHAHGAARRNGAAGGHQSTAVSHGGAIPDAG